MGSHTSELKKQETRVLRTGFEISSPTFYCKQTTDSLFRVSVVLYIFKKWHTTWERVSHCKTSTICCCLIRVNFHTLICKNKNFSVKLEPALFSLSRVQESPHV